MKLTTKEIAIFSMLGAVMYASKILMEWAPNIHLLGVFTIAFTIVYRKKALYPIYVYVMILGMLNGFASWWIPHLYLWTILWAVTMLLPRQMPKGVRAIVCMIICSLHGFAYGILYAPAQALLYGLSFDAMIAWIISGLPFDITHGISNFFCGILIVPIITTLRRAEAALAHQN